MATKPIDMAVAGWLASAKPAASMEAAQLAVYGDQLAAAKRSIRVAQNEVANVAAAREAIDALPDGARRIVAIDVGGAIAPAGEEVN
jgi:hypothetical protein